MLVTCAGLALRLNFSRLEKRDFGEEGSDDFIYKHRKEGDVYDDARALYTRGGNLACHAECNSRLRQEGDAEIIYNIRLAFREPCASVCAKIFT